ncbi:SDR family oxidoreductase [Fulvimarina sp. MAC3]|uniref:SDR family oxidoreductase n=1 Tax=Fulvimarina sp. MAC3 TaxID=3148887 RepID=UPI0031FBC328
MEVGVVGATGFIGREVTRQLIARGHRVRAFGRNQVQLAQIRSIGVTPVQAAGGNWPTTLNGLDAVVVAIGTIDPSGMAESHREIPHRIADAAEKAGITRLVLVSALGTSPDSSTDFLRTKAHGEDAVHERKLPGWTVVRPSLVYGPGGASMHFLAAIAAFPIRLRFDSGPIRPLQVNDLAAAIVDLLESDEPLPRSVDAVGPDQIDINDYIDALACWLMVGHRPGLRLPLGSVVRFASLLRLPFVNDDMHTMLMRGADGDATDLLRLTNTRPVGLSAGLARHPAIFADRATAVLAPWLEGLWYALALFWIVTGVMSIANIEDGRALLLQAEVKGRFASSLVLGGAVLDIGLGLFAFIRRTRRLAAAAQALTILFYSILATFLVPAAWADPLGQLLKNVPIFMATLLFVQLPKR